MEMIVCYFYDKKIVNRGFLIGPYCPIYGFGALIMLLLTPYRNNLFVCFILALVLCSFLEYFTSYLMEKMFHVRWWDYSNDSFNVNGRICLRNAVAFGALGVIFTQFLNPWFYSIINGLSSNIIIYLSIIVFIITIIDIFVSFNAMNSIKNIITKNLNKYKNMDATADIKKLIRSKLASMSFIEKRLIDSYHLLAKEKNYLKEKIRSVNNKAKNGYAILLIFMIFGIIIGGVLSFIFKLGSYKIIIPFTFSLCSLIGFIIMKVGNK